MGFLKKLFGGGEDKEPIVERNFMNIRIGDFLTYYGEDYEVFAVVDWMEEGFSWKEYKLEKNGENFWISAEIDDGELISEFYTVIKDFEVQMPPSKEIVYNNKKFELEEKGKAVGQITSKLGKQDYKCKYFRYEYEDEVFSVEDYDGDIEVSIGVELKESDIDILPGS